MRTTSAADLLTRAEQLTRELCATNDQIDHAQWARFDVTLYRTLYELVAAGRSDRAYTSNTRNPLLPTLTAYPAPLNIPVDRLYSVEHAAALLEVPRHRIERQIRNGTLRPVPDCEPRRIPASALQRGPRVAAAEPTDPRPLAQLSTTLGAFADLLSENNRSTHPVTLEDTVLANTARRVLSVGAVAARHVVTHTDIDAVDRPLRIARYASAYVDRLDTGPRRVRTLEQVVAVSGAGQQANVNQRLQTAIHTWGRTAHVEVERLVPSTEALASIASQGVRLYAVTHQLLGCQVNDQPVNDYERAERQLRQGAATLRDAERELRGITSLTAPSHDYVTAARELFTTLQEVRELAAAKDAGLDPRAALASLAHGDAVHARVVTAARGVPASLLHCHLLFAPVRNLEPTPARLHIQNKRRFIPVTVSDAPELAWRWDKAAATAPAVSATMQQLVAGRDVQGRDRGIELDR
jgi:hypothetical protein